MCTNTCSIPFYTFILAFLLCCYYVSHPLHSYCFIINSCTYSRCAKTWTDLNHQHCNISGIWTWKIFCTTSYIMQPPVHYWKQSFIQVANKFHYTWNHASHYARHNSTFSCTYTLKDHRPDCYYCKFCNFTIYYTLGIWPYLWLLVCCCCHLEHQILEYIVRLKSTDTTLLKGRKDYLEAVQLSEMLAILHITTVITLISQIILCFVDRGNFYQ